MANNIRIKRRASGSPGAPTSLANAELAFNEVDNTLYYGKGTGGVGGSATTVEAIAGSGATVMLAGDQTVADVKTFTSSPVVPTVTTSDNSTKVATTAFVKNQGYLLGNESITLSGDATGTGTTTIALTLANTGVTPGVYTKVTVDAKGRVTTGASVVAADISDFNTTVRANRLDQLAAPTATVSLNNQLLSNLATPVSATDAATKGYVDAARSGLDTKESVRATTTANITLSGIQTVDGISMLAGDRILVKDQTVAADNGIYIVDSGSWSRATDADSTTNLTSGMYCFVEEGATYADSGWVLITDGSITVGTTSLAFAQFSGAGTVLAANGITKNGVTVELTGQALAFHNLATNGFVVRTGAATIASRTISSESSSLTIANGNAVAGDPTFTLASALQLIGTVTPAADTITYFTGANAVATATMTSFGRSLLDDADAATARTTLELGTMAVQNASSVNITGGSIVGLTTFDNIVIDGGTF